MVKPFLAWTKFKRIEWARLRHYVMPAHHANSRTLCGRTTTIYLKLDDEPENDGQTCSVCHSIYQDVWTTRL